MNVDVKKPSHNQLQEISGTKNQTEEMLHLVRKTPSKKKLIGFPWYKKLKNEVASLANQSRKLATTSMSVIAELDDIDKLIENLTISENSRATISAHTASLAPITGKTVNVQDEKVREEINKHLRRKSEIRDKLLSEIENYNNQVVELQNWRASFFRKWLLDSLQLPEMESLKTLPTVR